MTKKLKDMKRRGTNGHEPYEQQAITFTAPQKKWLETVSESLGISLAELVRRIIDDYRGAGRRYKDEGGNSD